MPQFVGQTPELWKFTAYVYPNEALQNRTNICRRRGMLKHTLDALYQKHTDYLVPYAHTWLMDHDDLPVFLELMTAQGHG